MDPIRLSAELAAQIRGRIKSFDGDAIEKARKSAQDNGTFDVIISTEQLDRAGEIVRQNGWDLANYKQNPIVLWGHDYYALPIGICTEMYLTTSHGVPALGAKGVFLSADINPMAQQVRKMYEFGVKTGYHVGCTTSVGFIPKEFDEGNQSIITKSELLEFSFVDVPAQAGVGPATEGRKLTFAEADELGLDVFGLKAKGMSFAEVKGYIPKDVSEKKAPEDTPWSKPSLKDFTDKEWGDLSASEVNHIAGHYAWSANKPAKAFGDLKLPHHRAKDGAVVLRGVEAAMGALMGARGGVDVDGDKKAVYEHLAKHYRQFEKEPPELKTMKAKPQLGDSCEMDNGDPGILTSDPKDPNGPLVCQPQDQDKGMSPSGDEPNDDMKNATAFRKAVMDEHERHVKAVGEAFDTFDERAKAAVEDQPDMNGGDEEKKSVAKSAVEAEMKKHLKSLKSEIGDEQDRHRAENVAEFRSYEPQDEKEKKSLDIENHLKDLKAEHKEYGGKCDDALDDFEKKTIEGVPSEEWDEHIEKAMGGMGKLQDKHLKGVVKVAKAVCESFGEGDDTEEKRLAVLIMGIATEVGAKGITEEIALKIGAKLSADTKAKLKEAHGHLEKGMKVIEALHGDLAKEPEEDEPGQSASEDKDDLKGYLITRDVARSLVTGLNEHLAESRKAVRDISAA